MLATGPRARRRSTSRSTSSRGSSRSSARGRNPHVRGPSARRPSAGPALRAPRCSQADARHRRSAIDAARAHAPLFAYIAIRIRLDSQGPVFFRQTAARATTCAVHGAQVPDDVASTRTRGCTATTSSRTMTHAGAADGNGLYKLERARRRHAVRRAGCGRRASTSCRS